MGVGDTTCECGTVKEATTEERRMLSAGQADNGIAIKTPIQKLNFPSESLCRLLT